MRVALIDDESAVRETIRTILLHYYPQSEIKEATSVSSGLILINSFNPQLIFLDVEMSDGTGFDLLTRLENLSGNVVFVTAHDQYAVKAFKFSALDYILKPVDPGEIASVVRKIILDQNKSEKTKIEALLQNRESKGFDKIVLSDNSNIHLIHLDEIINCQAIGNYTHFFLSKKREIVISKTLKYYDDLLKDRDFIRIHQSYLINLNHLERYDKRDGGEVVMKDGRSIPVASRKRDLLFEVLRNFRS
jgi:two-component system, LytTR family, response regulator